MAIIGRTIPSTRRAASKTIRERTMPNQKIWSVTIPFCMSCEYASKFRMTQALMPTTSAITIQSRMWQHAWYTLLPSGCLRSKGK